MSGFIYETHLHTLQASACGKSPGRDYIRRYMDMGFSGIMVTDHFWHGNCGVDRSLPWKNFVERFCSGYEDAREEGGRLNFSVFFGWEEHYNNDEYLIYGLDKQWLLDHPEVITWNRREQHEQVRLAGGCIVQAHPFRERDYIKAIHLSAGCADAVEACNMANEPSRDILATRYARSLGIPATAGSDNHNAGIMDSEKTAGVVFDRNLESIHDYVNAIIKKEPFSLLIPEGRCDWQEDIEIHLPVDIRDRNDRKTQQNVYELLGIRIPAPLASGAR